MQRNKPFDFGKHIFVSQLWSFRCRQRVNFLQHEHKHLNHIQCKQTFRLYPTNSALPKNTYEMPFLLKLEALPFSHQPSHNLPPYHTNSPSAAHLEILLDFPCSRTSSFGMFISQIIKRLIIPGSLSLQIVQISVLGS